MRTVAPPAALFALLVLAWEASGRFFGWSEQGGALPSSVAARMLAGWAPLWRAVGLTVGEAVLGLLLGAALALPLAVAIIQWGTLRRVLYPTAVAFKAVPLVLVAPLFWGEGMLSKVLVATLIVFFPLLVNTVQGLGAVEPAVLDLARSVDASRGAVLWHLRLPTALPFVFPALRIASTLAMVGVVTAELSGPSQGAGHLITVARQENDPQLAVAVLLATILCNLGLFSALALLERAVVFWRRPPP